MQHYELSLSSLHTLVFKDGLAKSVIFEEIYTLLKTFDEFVLFIHLPQFTQGILYRSHFRTDQFYTAEIIKNIYLDPVMLLL